MCAANPPGKDPLSRDSRKEPTRCSCKFNLMQGPAEKPVGGLSGEQKPKGKCAVALNDSSNFSLHTLEQSEHSKAP